MTTSPLSLVVVNAGVSDPSSTKLLADRVASRVRALGQARGREVTTTVIDLRELLPELPAALASQHLGAGFKRAIAALVDADGIIAAAPVYKAGAWACSRRSSRYSTTTC